MRRLCWILLFSFLSVCCASLRAEQGAIQLSSQLFSLSTVTITNSGLYVFTEGVTFAFNADGIIVDADAVTIDLNGFQFRGPSGTYDHSAIRQVAGRNGLCIKNGFIDRWGSAAGAAALQLEGSNIRVEEIHLMDNRGLAIRAGALSVIRNCILFNNLNGGMTVGAGSSVTECLVISNQFAGIECLDSAKVEQCLVSGHPNGPGIRVQANTLINCNLSANNQSGMEIADNDTATGNVLTDNHVAGNATGIKAIGTGTNLLIGNSAMMSSLAEYDLAAHNVYGVLWASGLGTNVITNTSAALNFSVK